MERHKQWSGMKNWDMLTSWMLVWQLREYVQQNRIQKTNRFNNKRHIKAVLRGCFFMNKLSRKEKNNEGS